MSETEDYAGQPVTWDNVTGKPTEFAPEAHKTGHQDGGADEIDATGLAGRVNYVDRGDPSAADWSTLTLTVRDTWTSLDCSSIVGDGAKAIHIAAIFQASAVGKQIAFRKNGNVNTVNILEQKTQVANTQIALNGFVACDENGLIQYYISTATWAPSVVKIHGWLI